MLGMCFDKRVIGGLALVGVGVLVFAPNLFTAALPLLFIAICPLSMLFMGKAMMGGSRTASSQQDEILEGTASYACPMHRDETSTGPGRCRTCGMALVAATSTRPIDVPNQSGPALKPAEQIALLRLQLQRLGEQQGMLSQQIDELEASEISSVRNVDQYDAHQVERTASATRA